MCHIDGFEFVCSCNVITSENSCWLKLLIWLLMAAGEACDRELLHSLRKTRKIGAQL